MPNSNFNKCKLVPKKLNFSRNPFPLIKNKHLIVKKHYYLDPVDELEEEFEIIINFNNSVNNDGVNNDGVNNDGVNNDEFIKNENNICVKKIRNLIFSDDGEQVYYINPNGSKKVLLKKYLVAYKRVLDKKFTVL